MKYVLIFGEPSEQLNSRRERNANRIITGETPIPSSLSLTDCLQNDYSSRKCLEDRENFNHSRFRIAFRNSFHHPLITCLLSITKTYPGYKTVTQFSFFLQKLLESRENNSTGNLFWESGTFPQENFRLGKSQLVFWGNVRRMRI